MAGWGAERARVAVGNGIVDLGLTADQLSNLSDHVKSLWGLLGRVEGMLLPVADKLQEAKRLPDMAKDCSLDAAEKLGSAATHFSVAKGSRVPARIALPQNTLQIQEQVGGYTTKITDVERRMGIVGRQVAGLITELRDLVNECVDMSDVNGEVNGTLGAIAEQSRIAAELHANL